MSAEPETMAEVRARANSHDGCPTDIFDRALAAHDAQVRRDAAREALMGLQRFASECMDGKHGEIDAETFAGWHHTWAAAMQHRVDYYYPEESP